MFTHIDGTWTLDEAVERLKGNTRRYARKQLTWFKHDSQMTWFSPNDKQLILNHIKQ
jgi:tRNA dimethylallyltransferase